VSECAVCPWALGLPLCVLEMCCNRYCVTPCRVRGIYARENERLAAEGVGLVWIVGERQPAEDALMVDLAWVDVAQPLDGRPPQRCSDASLLAFRCPNPLSLPSSLRPSISPCAREAQVNSGAPPFLRSSLRCRCSAARRRRSLSHLSSASFRSTVCLSPCVHRHGLHRSTKKLSLLALRSCPLRARGCRHGGPALELQRRFEKRRCGRANIVIMSTLLARTMT